MSDYSTSFFSRFFLWSNVLGVSSAKTEYIYNFFTVDERINENGLKAVPGRITNEMTPSELGSPDVEQTIPRYVKVDFNYFGDTHSFEQVVFGDGDLRINGAEIRPALLNNQIVTEESLGSYDFTSYLYGNKQLEEVCDGFFRRLFTSSGVESASQLELLKEAAKKYSINPDLLEDIMPSSLKGTSLNALKYATSEIFAREELISDVVKLNSAYAPFMTVAAPMRGNLLYNLAAISRLKLALDSQTENLNHLWSLDENIFNIKYTSVERINEPDYTNEIMRPIGFVFEKNRIFDGQIYPMPTIIVEDPTVRSFIDTEIAADMVYEYKARAVYHVKVPMKASGSYDGWFVMEFYIASEMLPPVTIDCTEAVRPLPPATVEFAYSIQADRLRIDWRDIINDQQDIKYFQVFRRRYIEQPFELIAHLDFDDSIVRKENDEKIDQDLVLDLDYEITYFEDSGFDHDSDFIYAIICKDARMLSSTYSAQYRVRYDLNMNKTIVELISEAGAPKEFPNYKIRGSNRFPAMIKNSGQSSVKIIFDPECLGYIRSTERQDIGTDLFKTQKSDENSKFVFQFLNFDKIESDSIEIFIKSELEDFSNSLDTIPLSSNFTKHRNVALLGRKFATQPRPIIHNFSRDIVISGYDPGTSATASNSGVLNAALRRINNAIETGDIRAAMATANSSRDLDQLADAALNLDV